MGARSVAGRVTSRARDVAGEAGDKALALVKKQKSPISSEIESSRVLTEDQKAQLSGQEGSARTGSDLVSLRKSLLTATEETKTKSRRFLEERQKLSQERPGRRQTILTGR